jgi:hypothetical protein
MKRRSGRAFWRTPIPRLGGPCDHNRPHASLPHQPECGPRRVSVESAAHSRLARIVNYSSCRFQHDQPSSHINSSICVEARFASLPVWFVATMTNIWIGLLAGCLCASYRGRPAVKPKMGSLHYRRSELPTSTSITPKPSSLHSYPLNDLEEPGEWRRDRTEPQSACTVPKPGGTQPTDEAPSPCLIGE